MQIETSLLTKRMSDNCRVAILICCFISNGGNCDSMENMMKDNRAQIFGKQSKIQISWIYGYFGVILPWKFVVSYYSS